MPAKKVHLLIPEKIRIANSTIVKCHIDNPFDFQSDHVKNNELRLEYNMSFNIEDKLVKIDFQVEVVTDSNGENSEEAKGDFHFVFVYHMENLQDLVTAEKENQFELSGVLANVLASITYSTTRGLLMVKVKGTALENFILPVINPNTLIDKVGKENAVNNL